jgi:hypothetical protein
MANCAETRLRGSEIGNFKATFYWKRWFAGRVGCAVAARRKWPLAAENRQFFIERISSMRSVAAKSQDFYA